MFRKEGGAGEDDTGASKKKGKARKVLKLKAWPLKAVTGGERTAREDL